MAIFYNSNTINDWYFDESDIIKVYRNGAVCYYKLTNSGGTTSQTPCYAVVDNISQYQETEFEDVYNKADSKWYKLNNLNQYEEYGLYGSGRNITYYDGKLTIDNGYEYIYSGGSWSNVGEVSGSTATLPNAPFTVNYNAKNYDANTKTLAKTQGQLADIDAVITAGTPTVNDGYLTIASGTRATISGYQTYFNRNSNNPNLTIISKQRTDGYNCHMFANRDGNYNWMYRPYYNMLTLHGNNETGGIAVTTQPVIESVRVDSSRNINYNNYTNNTSSSTTSFNYGAENSGSFAMFQGFAKTTGENFIGDFYWVYMSQNTLTDDQVQQVIAYNEGGGTSEYPLYYDEKQDPPNNVSFSSMTEAEEYECPWVGMTGIIGGEDYIFDDNYDWVTKYQWVTISGEYVCEGTDKYSKIEKQQRNVDDTWTNLGIYSAGTLIESASTDCGYVPPIDYTKEYLTFVAETDNVTFTLYGASNSNIFKYSLDSGSTWNDLRIGQTSPSINKGDKIMWKASGLTVNTENGIGTIRPSYSAIVEGNIMSLCYGDNFSGQTNIQANYQFRKLFSGATNITSAENMVIPATSLRTQCYSQMFQGCTSMTATPKTIGEAIINWNGSDYVMSDMFHGCTSLTTVPDGLLPATNLGNRCYWAMFEDCTSLTNTPVLLATTLVNQCYYVMFNNCSSLNNVTCLATNTNTSYTYNWLSGVASSGTFTKASNVSWTSGNSGIPNVWTVVDYQSS